MKIPVDKIFEHVKMNEKFIHYLDDEEKNKEYHKSMEEQFEIMKTLKWEDFESLTADELERIPIAWLYDWTDVTGHWDYQDKVKGLYEKHNLPILTPREYLRKYEKKQPYEYCDIHSILPNFELKSYIKHFLIDDEEFINDVDTCMWELSSENKLKDKTPKQRFEYFSNTIGNEARTYILKILTLKHLLKILFNNIDGFTDEFWKDRLNKVLNKENLHKEYDKQLEKMLSNKFPNKTIEEISEMPIETILENRTNEEFELNKKNITDIITKKHYENKQNKQQEQTETCNKPTNEEKLQRINELVSQDIISISTLQRLFYISFPKAASIIDNLVENEIIERLEKGYKIIYKDRLKQILTETMFI